MNTKIVFSFLKADATCAMSNIVQMMICITITDNLLFCPLVECVCG